MCKNVQKQWVFAQRVTIRTLLKCSLNPTVKLIIEILLHLTYYVNLFIRYWLVVQTTLNTLCCTSQAS